MSRIDGDIFEEVAFGRLKFTHKKILQLIDAVKRIGRACVKVEQEMDDQVFAEVILLVDEAVKRENLNAIVELSVFGA